MIRRKFNKYIKDKNKRKYKKKLEVNIFKNNTFQETLKHTKKLFIE